jgi:pimeloyl-ACP methyl ester carboxylesterase
MNKTTKQIIIDDTGISVEIRGSETDTVWVFLHGWGSKKEVWTQVVKDFPATTALIDLPGFGGSDDVSEPWNTETYSQTITKLIKKLEFQNVVLAGHSFGGQIAASIAADRPEWLDGLVLVGAAVVRSKKPKLLSSVGSFVSPLFQLPVVNKLRPFIYRLIGADVPPDDENLKQTMRQTDKLPKIQVPTLVIWGDDDNDTSFQEAKLAVSSISNLTVSVLDGGHYIFIDARNAFKNKLLEFQEKLNKQQS